MCVLSPSSAEDGPFRTGVVMGELIPHAIPDVGSDAADATATSVQNTEDNFHAFLEKTNTKAKAHEIAQSLGGQENVNDVIERLGKHASGHGMLTAIYSAAQRLKLDPRTIAAFLFTEMDTEKNMAINKKRLHLPKEQVSLDAMVTMDNFSQDYNHHRLKPYLPKGFKLFRPVVDLSKSPLPVRDPGMQELEPKKYRLQNVRNMADAIAAVAAEICLRRKNLLDALNNNHHLRKYNINPADMTEDELDFWTYVFFNSKFPVDRVKDEIAHNIKHHVKNLLSVPSRSFQSSHAITGSLGNAQRMLTIKRLLVEAGMGS
jgi:hypothetical protein